MLRFEACFKIGADFGWPCGLRHRSAASRLLGSWVRIPLRAWMLVSCVCVGSGFCDELITCTEDSTGRMCLFVCYIEASTMRRPNSDLSC
jgi:hypothetical protein